ncbi:hypothetical protein NDU88_004896 [Pleurodeles waltl]|uniref:Uncharacterized protein n=1 Tax=Pleurodeles waltl TaxID=8319 RepID=A0AAV7T9Q4_PLEWA|nr:hypothetical protein NDU88_004896 [Pleurodeles waltl]
MKVRPSATQIESWYGRGTLPFLQISLRGVDHSSDKAQEVPPLTHLALNIISRSTPHTPVTPASWHCFCRRCLARLQAHGILCPPAGCGPEVRRGRGAVVKYTANDRELDCMFK